MSTPRPTAPNHIGSAKSPGGKPPAEPTKDQGRRKGSPDHRPRSTVSRSDLCQQTIGGCRRCAEYPDRRCPACIQRRRRATQLLEEGHSIEQIAASMRLTVPRAQRYIEEEEIARDLSHHRCDQIPAARIRKLYDQRREEDPTLSIAKIAHAAKLGRGTVSAALGPADRAPDENHDHAAEGQEDAPLVSVDVATPIVQALGFAPHEVDGL